MTLSGIKASFLCLLLLCKDNTVSIWSIICSDVPTVDFSSPLQIRDLILKKVTVQAAL